MMYRLSAKPVSMLASAQALPAARGISFQALNRSFEVESVERLANAVAQPFSPFLDALAKENSRIPAIPKQLSEDAPVWVPSLARAFPVTARLANSPMVRNVLLHDPKKAKKARLSWYNPYDTTWAPSGWFADGLVADMKYYYGDIVQPTPQQA